MHHSDLDKEAEDLELRTVLITYIYLHIHCNCSESPEDICIVPACFIYTASKM